MSSNGGPTDFDASPDSAMMAVRNFEGPVLVDLDETLYLSNSTEDFIDLARPALLALLLMRLLDVVSPWRWTGGDETRDVWRVRAISTFFPWTGKRWRTRVAGLAQCFANTQLLSAINSRSTPPIVATIGFTPIVEPLVAALGMPQAIIVSASLASFDDRRDGKLKLALKALGEDTISNGLVLTDSLHDLPLLNACAHPLRTIWPDARYRRALNGVYLPGQYLTLIKHPGRRYIIRGILQEDFAFWVLASTSLAAVPVAHVLGLLALLVSFWAIYERGYVDNDLVASRYEQRPQLTPAFQEITVATPRLNPWIWALIFGAAAVFLLRWPRPAAPQDFLKWGGVLLLTHFWYWLYNYFDKNTRIWMYSGLQLSRSAAFAALVPIAPVGALAISAHVLARWIPYYIYRLSNGTWPEVSFNLTRLLFLVILSAVACLTAGPGILLSWTALAVFGWTAFRARQEFGRFLFAAHRIDRSKAGANP